jgi:hypothetical protein
MNLKTWALLAAAMVVFAWATSPVRAVSENVVAEAEPVGDAEPVGSQTAVTPAAVRCPGPMQVG